MTSPSTLLKDRALLVGIVAGIVIISLAAALPALFIWKEFLI
ncbi:hypothetical protein [Kushneria pakistanensis]|nr:hypothetical protein [Kushneria pakistanensis]